MSDCACEEGKLADTECPKHGLYGSIAFPPMDRHARWIEEPIPGGGTMLRKETAAEVQRRLYLANASPRVRAEAAGFRWPIRACPPREGLSQR